MVSYITVGLLLVLCVLAIISRKNYSKYKDGFSPLWWLSFWVADHINKAGIMDYVRKTKPLNTKALSREVYNRIAVNVHDLLRILIAFLIILAALSFVPERKEDLYTIERPEIGQDPIYVDVKLTDKDTDDLSNYSLEVNPREYTREEFNKVSMEAEEYIDSVILGTNSSRDHVTENMFFPTRYEDSALKIIWETDMPTVLGSDGKIVADSLEHAEHVNITATIKDANYSREYKTYAEVSQEDHLSNSDKAKVAMLNIEGENRAEKEFKLPRELENVLIERNVETKDEKLNVVLLFGFLVIALMGFYKYSKLKEQGEKRDEDIGDAYYGFTNRLAIYIGAGFTLQKSFRYAIRNEKCMFLVNEIEYTLNMIDSGISEPKAYMELGNRLGLEEYMRLMSLISQNLNFGNSNLLKLLDTEVKTSFFLKKERVRKKGEQASEKLLIPTAILLITVIIVVMFPAFIGMR
ncbi:MAG: type II secretion system F family protein [Eubacterium sp.]|nr:type II secretion system F family protein [Eubacterium sp.]